MTHERTERKIHKRGPVLETFHGEHFDFTKVSNDVNELSIRNVRTIDLSGVRTHDRLEHLFIESDEIEEIDLIPLKESDVLKTLWISSDSIEELDLSPLHKSPSLEMSTLSSLSLKSLDLSPLVRVRTIQIKSRFSIIDLSTLEKPLDTELGDKIIHLFDCSGDRFTPEGLPRDTTTFGVSNCKELKTLDLSPIINSEHLRNVVLENNALTSIDLSPMASCDFDPKYVHTEIKLRGNQLSTIELHPLARLEQLRELDLTNNTLNHIDLSPLATCSGLMYIRLSGNPLEEIDVSPLFRLKHLREVTFPVEKNISEPVYPRIIANNELKDQSPYWLRKAHSKDRYFKIEYV